jgi:hypothetical protein
MTAIEAVALLHQSQRQRNREGWIVATLDDYEQVRRLLAPVFEATAAEGLTQAIRQTVEAIEPGECMTQAALAERLGLRKSTISWRVERAIAGGWLVNSEGRKGRPARLSRGNELPEATTALPTVEQVRALFETQRSSNDGSNGLS